MYKVNYTFCLFEDENNSNTDWIIIWYTNISDLDVDPTSKPVEEKEYTTEEGEEYLRNIGPLGGVYMK